MANPLSSVKNFFGWDNQNDAVVVDRSPVQPATSITSKISGGIRRPQVSSGTIITVDATAYSDAKLIAEEYRAGASVIVNMADMSELDQRRMVDFMSGLKEGLNGGLQRVATKVFLLVPSTVSTNAEEGDEDEFGAADGLVINPMR
jgi:cell division inhibitor SepF